jgi:hypothetical protein
LIRHVRRLATSLTPRVDLEVRTSWPTLRIRYPNSTRSPWLRLLARAGRASAG